MVGLAIAILSFWLIVVGIALLIRFFQSTQRGQGRRIRQSRTNPLVLEGPSPNPHERVNRQTQQKLLTLLNGDRRTADRLLQNVRFRYPDQSENWYWEKVIYDLRRDRRG